jgi:antitoxin YefM
MSTVQKQTYSVSEIQEEILWVAGEFDLSDSEDEEPVVVVDQGKPIMAIISFEEYDSLRETLEVVNDDELVAQLCQVMAEEDEEEGKGRPWEEVVKDLGW